MASTTSGSTMALTASAAAAKAARAATTVHVGPSASLPRRRRGAAPAPTAMAGAVAPAAKLTKRAAHHQAAAAAAPSQDDLDLEGTNNVVVLGGSYGGMHAATVLAQKLPPSHRVILIDRNSHFNHLYVFPRFSVLSGHEHKAFIPYTSIFNQAPDRTAKKHKGKAGEADKAAGANASGQTFDLEMGSTAPASRSAAASSSRSSSKSSSASSAASSLSPPSPTEDDYGADSRSDLSASSENVTLDSASLFDRASSRFKGAQSAASLTSTLSSFYSSSASNDGDEAGAGAGSGDDEPAVLADKLKARLSLASTSPERGQGLHSQRRRSQSHDSGDEQLSTESTPSADQARPLTGSKAEEVKPPKLEGTLHVHEDAPPAEAVHEQDALGREPMRVETASSTEPAQPTSSSTSVQDGDQAQDDEHNPYAGAPPHMFLQGSVTDIKPDHVLVEVAPRPSSDRTADDAGKHKQRPLWNITSRTVRVPYTHLIYALGSHLPDPLRTDARTKPEGMNWMRQIHERVRDAEDVVLVGGGALGVQFASDIASVFGTKTAAPHESCQRHWQQTGEQPPKRKKVTLIHSRDRLLPNFDERIHEIALRRLRALGVDVVLGERLALTDGCPMGSATIDDRVPFPRKSNESNRLTLDVRTASSAELSSAAARPGRKLVRTTKGKLFHADVLLLCTGQQPNSALMSKLSPSSVDPRTRLVKVRRTLQVERLPGSEGWGGVMEAQAPCGDCDCFMDRKTEVSSALGGTPAGSSNATQAHSHDASTGTGATSTTTTTSAPTCDCGSTPLVSPDADEEAEERTNCIPNVYAIGDVADAFGALNAGYQAWAMADVAAENVLRDLGVGGADALSTSSTTSTEASTTPKMLRRFKPIAPMLKLSLGLGTMAWQGGAVPHRQPKAQAKAKATVQSEGSTSGALSTGSTTPTAASAASTKPGSEHTHREQQDNDNNDDDEDDGMETVLKPEIAEKEDPHDLGVEGVWKFMANADTSDLYL